MVKKTLKIILSISLLLSSIVPTFAAAEVGGRVLNESSEEIESLENVSAKPINESQIAVGKVHADPHSVVSEVYGTQTIQSSVYQTQSVQSSVYGINTFAMAAASGETYDIIGLGQVNINPDESPYKIDSQNESISTLSGGLSIVTSDLTLPGRGDASFTLGRIYSSSDTEIYKPTVKSVVPGNYTLQFEGVYYKQSLVNGSVITPSRPSYRNIIIAYDNWFDREYMKDWILNNRGQIKPLTDWYVENGSTVREVVEIKEGTKVPHTDEPLIPKRDLYTNWIEPPAFEYIFDKPSPLGVGWQWNIPHMTKSGYTKYLVMMDGSSYEVLEDNGSVIGLKDYPWWDYGFSGNNEYGEYELRHISGMRYIFSGLKLSKIVDTYDNEVTFSYISHPTYGSIIDTITDSIGNKMEFKYYDDRVEVSLGDRTIRYNKLKKEIYYPHPSRNKPFLNTTREFLESYVDAQDRRQVYEYTINNESRFSFTGPTPTFANPTAALTKVTHPTGAASEYTYGSTPRLIGEYSRKHVPKVNSREDVIKYDNGTIERKNRRDFSYDGDMAGNDVQDYDSDSTFSTIVKNGLTEMKYDYRRDWIDKNTSSQMYNTKVVEKGPIDGGLQERITEYTYDEAKRRPAPLTITSKTVNTVNNVRTESTKLLTTRTYNNDGNVLTETNPFNLTTTYTYGQYGNYKRLLKSVTQPIDNSKSIYTEYTRNDRGRITEKLVRENNVSGKIIQQVQYPSFDAYGNPLKMIIKDDQRDIISEYEYGEQYKAAFPTKQTKYWTDEAGNRSSAVNDFSYNSSTGQLTQSIDGNRHTTNYEYDKLGRITKVIFPDTNVKKWNYDDLINKLTAVDETGISVATEYNPLGWKISQGIVNSGFTKYGYDQFGRNTWIQDARSNRTDNNYDAWGRLTQTSFPGDGAATTSYDDINRTQTLKDAESNQYRDTYDELGRMIKKEWIKGAGNVTLGSFTYDNVGNKLSSTDGNNNKTSFNYDVLGRVISVTDPEDRTTQYSYSLAGNMTQIQYADGNKQQKQYDELGHVIRKVDPAGLVEKYYYDANGNISKYIDRKEQKQTYNYNNRNLLTSNVSANETITYTYDAAGRRLTMEDATGKTVYEYDSITKRQSSVTFPDKRTLTYQYDVQGNRTQMTDPFGYKMEYDYDTRNRLTAVGPSKNDWDASYVYKENNLLSSVQLRNGIKTEYNYDGANLTGLVQKQSNGQTLNSFSYGYDNNSNQTSRNENGNPYNFGYDKLDRIETSSQFNETYTYDSRGNRQTVVSSNAMNIGGSSFHYDDRNRLTQVITGDGKNVSYRYNGDGLLYERTENGQTTRYYNDGANIIAEGNVTNGSASLKARYIRGKGLVALTDASDSKSYYVQNGHGDIVGLTNGSGNWVSQYSYDIWGNPLSTPGNIDQPFRYSGELWDSSTNLQYLRARWYDPSIGRFINQDTYEGDITNPLSLNLYTYAHNNPTRYVDPTGHNIFDVYLYEKTGYHRYNSQFEYYNDNWRDIGAYYVFGMEEILTLIYSKDPQEITDAINSLGMSFVPVGKAGKVAARVGKWSDEVGDVTKVARKAMGCNCFVAGTKVLTINGEKAIEDIEVGDKVLSKNEETGEIAYKEVIQLHGNEKDVTYKLSVGEQIIETTDNHPFWVKGKGWVLALNLRIGDELQQSNGDYLIINSIEIVKHQEKVKVFNFTVADFHTYFVSNLGIWVHNISCYDGFKRFESHYDKHVLGKNGGMREYGDDFTKEDYYHAAFDLASSTIDGTNIIKRFQGDTEVIFRRSTNDIVYIHSDGEIGSFYKPKFGSSNPNAGYDYFIRTTTENPSP
ncbi:polymorphic toxin-type HINT domain-containing protein [Paenibacillus sp. NPDC056579]|uniref:polymorphic toxin-type HINT domain-containing protein n=1 Tax=Paenibacillus sp. NPDC056579 TaxID=3345871 RepID=UPI0036C0C14F